MPDTVRTAFPRPALSEPGATTQRHGSKSTQSRTSLFIRNASTPSELEALLTLAAAALLKLLLQSLQAPFRLLARGFVERDVDGKVAAGLRAFGEERGGQLDLMFLFADEQNGRAAVLDAVDDGARAFGLFLLV